MAHELENRNGTWSFAFSMIDGPGWHNRGTMVSDSASSADWRKAAGHDFTVSKHQVFFRPTDALVECPDRFVVARDDNQYALGVVSDVYKIVQPSEIDDMCDKFASFDANLKRSAAFTLRQGDMICSTYAYHDTFDVAGDTHKAYLMASTTFDGSGATNFWISITRAVCQNTIRAGLNDSKAKISVRHNGTLVADRVAEQLAALAQNIKAYKALGDALAGVSLSKEEVSAFFKATLDIELTAKAEDISTRKMNQFADLTRAYATTRKERNGEEGKFDAFTALQAATRYADHDRGVKVNGTGDETVARFDSAHFGDGAKYKARAMGLLLPLVKERLAA